MKFNSLPQQIDILKPYTEDLRTLPQLYRASVSFSRSFNNKELDSIVDAAVFNLSKFYRYISIDTRLSMLMPGMYPCIPGWHCDDFYRPSGDQPDLLNAPESEHVMLILGDCSRTRFVAEEINLELPSSKDLETANLYGILHKKIENLQPKTLQVSAGELWKFSQLSWHRGEAATEAGWRYFVRVSGSWNHKPLNQVRTQTQVYLTDPFMGW